MRRAKETQTLGLRVRRCSLAACEHVLPRDLRVLPSCNIMFMMVTTAVLRIVGQGVAWCANAFDRQEPAWDIGSRPDCCAPTEELL